MPGGELVKDRGPKDSPQLVTGRREAIGDHAVGFEASEPELESESNGQFVLALGFGLFGRPLQVGRILARRSRSLVRRARGNAGPPGDEENPDKNAEPKREHERYYPTPGAESAVGRVHDRHENLMPQPAGRMAEYPDESPPDGPEHACERVGNRTGRCVYGGRERIWAAW